MWRIFCWKKIQEIQMNCLLKCEIKEKKIRIYSIEKKKKYMDTVRYDRCQAFTFVWRQWTGRFDER